MNVIVSWGGDKQVEGPELVLRFRCDIKKYKFVVYLQHNDNQQCSVDTIK